MSRILACFLGLLFVTTASAQQKGPAPRQIGGKPTVAKTVSKIDQHTNDFWTREGVTVAPLSDDGEFLRRLSLDLVGKVPSAAEARAFLAAKDPNKRIKKIDELMARPGYLNHFASVLRQSWVPQTTDNPQLQFAFPPFETWIRAKLKENLPMDKVVREILTTKTLFTGRGAQTFNRDQSESPFLFLQANEFKPENVAASASRLFMGVKIECAQCHNHPFAPYKKEQFWELAAFFAEVQPTIANLSDMKVKREIKIPDSPKVVPARFFDDGQEPPWDDKKSPREIFSDWLTSAKNPYFARNIVNRTWAHFLGRGMIEPIDEPSEDNPPVVPEVLDELSKAFIESGYDLRFLFQVITRTRAYQLTSRQTHESQANPKMLARMAVKAMTGEQLFDSLAIATGFVDPSPPQQRQFSGTRREFLTKFSSTEKLTEKQTSILQALTMMNGSFVKNATSAERSRFLGGVIDAPFLNTRSKIETLYLATQSRMPAAEELEKHASYVDRGGNTNDKQKALGDVFWALLNSSEFMLNH